MYKWYYRIWHELERVSTLPCARTLKLVQSTIAHARYAARLAQHHSIDMETWRCGQSAHEEGMANTVCCALLRNTTLEKILSTFLHLLEPAQQRNQTSHFYSTPVAIQLAKKYRPRKGSRKKTHNLSNIC